MGEARPQELDHYFKAVALLLQAGQTQRAEEVLKQALKGVPDDYRLHLALGRLYLRAKEAGVQGAREKAIASLNAALKGCKSEATKATIRRLLGQATK
jgi:predicted Zn-dependent protease